MTTPPQLPVELIIKIFTLSATDLAEQELQMAGPTAPELAAPFLLAAALVSRTWTPIAQEPLIQYTPVTYSRAPNMAEKLKTRPGAVRSVRVKGCAGGSCTEALETVLRVLESLEEVTIYGHCDGRHLRFSEAYRAPFHASCRLHRVADNLRRHQ